MGLTNLWDNNGTGSVLLIPTWTTPTGKGTKCFSCQTLDWSGPNTFPSRVIRLQLHLNTRGQLGLPCFQGPWVSYIPLPLFFSTQLVSQTQWAINNEQSSFLRLQANLSRSFILTLGAFHLLELWINSVLNKKKWLHKETMEFLI